MKKQILLLTILASSFTAYASAKTHQIKLSDAHWPYYVDLSILPVTANKASAQKIENAQNNTFDAAVSMLEQNNVTGICQELSDIAKNVQSTVQSAELQPIVNLLTEQAELCSEFNNKNQNYDSVKSLSKELNIALSVPHEIGRVNLVMYLMVVKSNTGFDINLPQDNQITIATVDRTSDEFFTIVSSFDAKEIASLRIAMARYVGLSFAIGSKVLE